MTPLVNEAIEELRNQHPLLQQLDNTMYTEDSVGGGGGGDTIPNSGGDVGGGFYSDYPPSNDPLPGPSSAHLHPMPPLGYQPQPAATLSIPNSLASSGIADLDHLMSGGGSPRTNAATVASAKFHEFLHGEEQNEWLLNRLLEQQARLRHMYQLNLKLMEERVNTYARQAELLQGGGTLDSNPGTNPFTPPGGDPPATFDIWRAVAEGDEEDGSGSQQF